MTDTIFILTSVSKGDDVRLPTLLLLNICKLLLAVIYTVGITGKNQPQVPLQKYVFSFLN